LSELVNEDHKHLVEIFEEFQQIYNQLGNICVFVNINKQYPGDYTDLIGCIYERIAKSRFIVDMIKTTAIKSILISEINGMLRIIDLLSKLK